jgi:RNA polymerase sigma factor (sigma-70 family)
MLQTAKVDIATGIPRSQVEQQLVAAARSGDRGAFEALVTTHKSHISRVAFIITRNREDSEDVAQMVFLKAFANLQSFEGRSSFLTWLTRIAVNESLMQIRRRGGITLSLDDVPDGGGTKPRSSPGSRYSSHARAILQFQRDASVTRICFGTNRSQLADCL